ncbi:ABC transporter permease [Alteribacter populi]|uniref:ABC transporter permease n=1 Tax=Alteribacter populi TaxID=2011011 RepID=UPI000BBAE889|nr:ABC transporter permease [Alteribacter populi]
MTIFTFALKRSFRSLGNVILLLVLPIAVILLPVGEWSVLPLGYQFYGMIMLFGAARLVQFIMEDRSTGVLKRIGVAPVTHFQYLWQSLLAYSLILIGQNAVVIVGGMLVHGQALIAPLLLFVVYSFFSLTAIALCLAWISLYRNKDSAFLILMNVIILMAMLGGIFWPVEIMPDFFQRIAMLLPTYWLTEGLSVIISSKPLVELIIPLVILLLFTMAFVLLGSKRRIA